MKKILIISAIIIIAIVGLFFVFTSGGSKNQTSQPSQSSQIANEIANGSAVLLDVRTLQEFNAGHAAQAINFDSVRVNQGELPDIPKSKKIYLYCRSGHRAAQVKQSLESKGYQNIVNLGGLPQMKNIGFIIGS